MGAGGLKPVLFARNLTLNSDVAPNNKYPVSILHKSIAGRYRPVRVADGPITARCRFIKNASWDIWLVRIGVLYHICETVKHI